MAYCENLTKAVQSARNRVAACWHPPPEGGHPIILGQWVMILSFKSKPLETKWQEPYRVLLVTALQYCAKERKLGLISHTVKYFHHPQGQIRTTRPVRSPGKNRSAIDLGGKPGGEESLIGFSPFSRLFPSHSSIRVTALQIRERRYPVSCFYMITMKFKHEIQKYTVLFSVFSLHCRHECIMAPIPATSLPSSECE